MMHKTTVLLLSLALGAGVFTLGSLSGCGSGSVAIGAGFGDDINNFTDNVSGNGDTVIVINADCNDNGVADQDDIANGTSGDCNGNTVPDDCEYDRDHDGLPDDCVPLPTDPSAPGSLLVFPEWDNSFIPNSDSRQQSLLTVTNTSDLDVDVWLTFFDPSTCEPPAGTLVTAPRIVTLRPYDTYTVNIDDPSVANHRGYAVACAVDADGEAIARNVLIGSVVVSRDSPDELIRGIEAIAFQAVGEPGERTDVDLDGLQDLDGVEYSAAPDAISFAGFFGQHQFAGESSNFEDYLIVIQLSETGLSELTVDFDVRNDQGLSTTDQYVFSTSQCWNKELLRDVTSGVWETSLEGTANDPAEIVGWNTHEAGWLTLSGQSTASGSTDEPAMLAVLIQGSIFGRSNGYGISMSPVFSGTRTTGSFDLGLPTTGRAK